MKRKCDGKDPTLVMPQGGEYVPCAGNCEFDDAACSVIFPHSPLPPKLTEAELFALYDQVFGGSS